MNENRSLTVLGSTGSIGTQSLQVAKMSGYEVKAITANKSIKLFEEQIREFSPQFAVVVDKTAYSELKIRVADTNTKLLCGSDAVCEIAANVDSDIVLNSIVGIAGLKPTLATVSSGKKLALANKESLVTAGELVKAAAKKSGSEIIPVDSEHSAIFQCLQGTPKGSLKKILLTASGGPFFGKTRKELENIKPSDALKHPNWDMGAKITIDSATLMNKGLEVIEAVHLFDVSANDIEVLVHRQSVVHSAVELTDGAVIAQLGVPDMKLPIQYAITYPQRVVCGCDRLDLFKYKNLTFEKPDTDTFVCLNACINAINRGGIAPAAVNGANEEAVKLFLDGKISFLDIGILVSKTLETVKDVNTFNVNDVFEADLSARQTVLSNI